jgi:glyoxylase-like metal-dependent hydrolase (beta-lactamase superfamily II)
MTFPGGGPGTVIPDGNPEAVREIQWLIPHFATADGYLKMSVHALLVEAPSGRFIVDTCVGNHKPRTTPSFNMLATRFLDDLASVGWDRDSVSGVLCTHLHVDHVGWNTMLEGGRWVPTFPNARYYIGRQEFEHWSVASTRPDTVAMLGDSVQPILDANLATFVETDTRISPELRLMPTPGHTPGHVSVVIESQGKSAVITGDVMHHPCQIARPDWSSDFDSDKVLSKKTRGSFLSLFGDTRTLVIGTHFCGPTAGHLVSDGAGYRFEA